MSRVTNRLLPTPRLLSKQLLAPRIVPQRVPLIGGLRCASSHTVALCLKPRATSSAATYSWPRACLRRALSTQSSDPYSILGVSRGPPAPTDADIKKAYFKLAKENHPDLNQSPEAEQRFREVAEAYEILKTAYSRHRYEFDGGFAGGFAGGRPGSAGDAQQRGHPYYGAPRWRPRGWENEIFRHVWSELGVQEIDEYIARVQVEAGRALGLASKGDLSLARQFAMDHKALLIGTIGPALILLRVPQAAILSTRLIYPVLFLARILPPRIQYYLFSRLWVRAILHMERVVNAALDGSSSQTNNGDGSRFKRKR